MLMKSGELEAWTLSNKPHSRIDLLELAQPNLPLRDHILSRIPHCTTRRLVETNFQRLVAAIARQTIYLMGERRSILKH